ncbi:MAG TPA: HAD-IA family hydrolase [Polyangiaceae bacterium]|nr:HAD-IA family hydrolase [Polyangiaceae bacterium]
MAAADEFDAWLLDLDGTLYRARWVKLLMAAELAIGGWSAVAPLRRFRHEHELIREQGETNDPFRLQLTRTAEALKMEPDELAALVQSWMIERPGRWLGRFKRSELFDEIRTFRAGGGKTAVVSDYPARSKLRALGASALFDAVVASGEPGGPRRLKPDPGGYLRAADALGVRPERCLVIGDRDDADGAAARAAGMSFRLVR